MAAGSPAGAGAAAAVSDKKSPSKPSSAASGKQSNREKNTANPTSQQPDEKKELDLSEVFSHARREKLMENFRVSTVKNRQVISRKPASEKRPPRKPSPPRPPKPETLQLLDAIYSASEAKDAVKAIDAYHRLPIKPDIKLYTALINSMTKDGLITEAVEIWHDILKQRVQPNLATFLALISVCESVGHLERAMWVIKEMLRIKGTFKSPKDELHTSQLNGIYNTALRICFKKYSPARAAALFNLMKSRNMPHTRHTSQRCVVPWEFVLRFADASNAAAEIRARQFHFEMERILKPHTRPNPFLDSSIGGVPISQAQSILVSSPRVLWE